MGKLRISSLRKKAEPADALTWVPKSPAKTIDQHAEHIEFVEPDNKAFPIVRKDVKDDALPFIPADEVRRRDGKSGNHLWIVVEGLVLDATAFQHEHPGGRAIITSFGGLDCTWQWRAFHGRQIWRAYTPHIRVGRTEGVPNPYQKPPTIVGLRKHGFQDFD